MQMADYPGGVLDFIIANGEKVVIRRGQVLHDKGQRLQSIYFILDGLVSVSLPDAKNAPVEVLTLGSGEFSGLPFALSAQMAPHCSLVQVPGLAVRLTVSDLDRILERHKYFHNLFAEIISMQSLYSSYLVACNARHSVSQRLSRWLLTASDQLRSTCIPVTHRVIAEAIGVRRAGVTNEVGEFQGRSLLATTRGTITIVDRGGLEQCACGCYEPVRAARVRGFNSLPASRLASQFGTAELNPALHDD